jgi:hypothetical protein
MRVRNHLQTVGYGWAALDDNTITSTLAILFIQVGQAKLEALSVEVIEAAHRAAPASSDRRSSLYRLVHALHGMGREYPRCTSPRTGPVKWPCLTWRR